MKNFKEKEEVSANSFLFFYLQGRKVQIMMKMMVLILLSARPNLTAPQRK
jgi:hypothetical protein